jgi:imidazolonepropionase-like amidohydrolase
MVCLHGYGGGLMPRTVLSGGRVFDGTGSPAASADVVIGDGKIIDVGTGLDGDEQVDVRGLTVLPGLFDCHVHVMVSGIDLARRLQRPFSYQFFLAARNLAATLDCGITTVRDAGGADLGVQRAVEDGLIDGPRIQISVSPLTQTGGHGDGWLPSGTTTFLIPPHPGRPHGLADGPDEVRKRVREIIRAGADVIKVHASGGVLSPRDHPKNAQFQPDELAVLVAEATAADLPVMAHAQAVDGIKNALRAGVRSIEHGIYLDDEAIDMMLAAGTWLVPTLVAPHAVLNAASTGSRLHDGVAAKAEDVIAEHARAFARAVAAGVKIAMGTDSGVGPHGGNLDELPLMEAGGMTPAQVLTATTQSAAELMRIGDQAGTIMPGKRADLVLVAGDPYDLANLKASIRAVYKAGTRVRG